MGTPEGIERAWTCIQLMLGHANVQQTRRYLNRDRRGTAQRAGGQLERRTLKAVDTGGTRPSEVARPPRFERGTLGLEGRC